MYMCYESFFLALKRIFYVLVAQIHDNNYILNFLIYLYYNTLNDIQHNNTELLHINLFFLTPNGRRSLKYSRRIIYTTSDVKLESNPVL